MSLLEILRDRFFYDIETGEFAYKKSVGRNTAGTKAGTLHSTGYVHIGINGKTYKAHRLAWLWSFGSFPTRELDHINGIRSDNKMSNLRLATSSQNKQNVRNRKRQSQTGFIGVVAERSKFRAEISVDGKRKRLGTFETAEMAFAAYAQARANQHTHFVGG